MASISDPYAQLRETHTGLVVLCGDRAYKVKKPIVTDFLDFGTAAKREQACARELELNRRLAPDVYLGVGHLTDPTGGAREPVLIMRRMPDAARLSTRLATRAEEGVELTALAEMLARFHRTAVRGPRIAAAGTPGALRARWDILLRSLREQPSGAVDLEQVEAAGRMAARYLDGRAPLLAQRVADGRVLDGHGDLLAEDIFVLDDGFRALDCLDFDDELRYVDGLDDAAFLAMDLEYLGHPDLSEDFLHDYLRAADDPAPMSLRHHYIAYRALVRAKTDRLRAAQGDPEAAAHARRHLELTVGHLARGAVRLVLVGGLPGTGKSTVATHLADVTEAEVLSSDAVRAQLRRAGVLTGAAGDFGAGVYRADAKRTVYAHLLDHARDRLHRGVSVILDASWTDTREFARAAALAHAAHAEFVPLWCTCPRSIADHRLRTRPPGDSDATPEIAAALAADTVYPPQATVLDTDGPLPDTLAAARDAWDRCVTDAETPSGTPVGETLTGRRAGSGLARRWCG